MHFLISAGEAGIRETMCGEAALLTTLGYFKPLVMGFQQLKIWCLGLRVLVRLRFLSAAGQVWEHSGAALG